MLPHNRNANCSTSIGPIWMSGVTLTSWRKGYDLSMLTCSSPYVSAYIFANDLRVKHHPIAVEANETLPFSGDSRRAGSGSMSLRSQKLIQQCFGRATETLSYQITVLTSSMVCRILKYASSGGSRSSRIKRSILLRTRVMGTLFWTR